MSNLPFPSISWMKPKESPKAKAWLGKPTRRNNEAVRQLLDGSKRKMTAFGFSDGDIEITTRPRMLDVAKDIMEYSTAKSFDARIKKLLKSNSSQ